MKLLKWKYSSQVQWGVTDDDKVESYFEIYFELPCQFTITTNNVAFCSHNLFSALRLCVEHLCVKSAKYDALKERVKTIKRWKEL